MHPFTIFLFSSLSLTLFFSHFLLFGTIFYLAMLGSKGQLTDIDTACLSKRSRTTSHNATSSIEHTKWEIFSYDDKVWKLSMTSRDFCVVNITLQSLYRFIVQWFMSLRIEVHRLTCSQSALILRDHVNVLKQTLSLLKNPLNISWWDRQKWWNIKYSPRSSDSKRCDCATPILQHQYRKLAALSRAKNDPGVASARQRITRRMKG